MVRINKWMPVLLFFAVLWLSPLSYGALKSINNLPANQDMDMISRDYKNGEKILGVTDSSGECIGGECFNNLNDTAKCNKCVDLQILCPDCCLNDSQTAARCTAEDSEDYSCGVELFGFDSCDKVICEDAETDCKSECVNRDDYTENSVCKESEGTAGVPRQPHIPYGLIRKGCPDADSQDLAPNGNCVLVAGSGLARKWKCSGLGLEPRFIDTYTDNSKCLADSEVEFSSSKPPYSGGYGEYYAVTKVSPDCEDNAPCTASCSGSCSCTTSVCPPITTTSSSCAPVTSCGPSGSCVPAPCQAECKTKTAQVCAYSCVAGTACSSADTSTSDCECRGLLSNNPPSSCSPQCENNSDIQCSVTYKGNCEAAASSTYYVYTLSQKYQDYINECISKADGYEKCQDRINCCRKGVCPNEVNENGQCNSGFDFNCDLSNCGKRLCYKENCVKYAGSGCAMYASDARGCLGEKKDCFVEIDESFNYRFVARNAESMTVIWQIITKPPSVISSGVHFYTLVKVLETATKNEIHTSMMNVKSLEAAFSIYGTTHIPKEDLKAGVSYQVRLYYFLPSAEFCFPLCESQPDACAKIKLEVDYAALTAIRVRE